MKERYIEVQWAALKLALQEWNDLLQHSARYEFKKRIESSVFYAPAYMSLEIVLENIKKISSRGHMARIRLSRILVRMIASALNQNLAAFEAALKDLIALGKSV